VRSCAPRGASRVKGRGRTCRSPVRSGAPRRPVPHSAQVRVRAVGTDHGAAGRAAPDRGVTAGPELLGRPPARRPRRGFPAVLVHGDTARRLHRGIARRRCCTETPRGCCTEIPPAGLPGGVSGAERDATGVSSPRARLVLRWRGQLDQILAAFLSSPISSAISLSLSLSLSLSPISLPDTLPI
jgi:hypothetical protein